MGDNVVCRCMNVTEQVVLDYVKTNPNWSTKQVVEDLRIGSRCRCCTHDDCHIIDKHYKEVLVNLEK